MYSDIAERYLSIHMSVGQYRLDAKDGLSGAEEYLKRAETVRDEMIEHASASELREIALAMKESLDYTVMVRAIGFEDVLEYFETLQQGLRNGISWSKVHVEHLSGRKSLEARHWGA